MPKRNPFDYVKAINEKTVLDDLTGYIPFLTNAAFSMHLDTILLAEEMNQAHTLPPHMQYDFMYNAVRKGKRFGFRKKPEVSADLELIQEYYGYSYQKALSALELLTPEQITEIRHKMDKGGRV